MMALLTAYVYMKPYRIFYVNVLQSVVLADILLLLLIASTNQFKVTFHAYMIIRITSCICIIINA